MFNLDYVNFREDILYCIPKKWYMEWRRIYFYDRIISNACEMKKNYSTSFSWWKTATEEEITRMCSNNISFAYFSSLHFSLCVLLILMYSALFCEYRCLTSWGVTHIKNTRKKQRRKSNFMFGKPIKLQLLIFTHKIIQRMFFIAFYVHIYVGRWTWILCR